jgi:hypothetical protein
VKLDVDTLPTVPDAPPEAGPDRALDPPPPEAGPPAERLAGTRCPAVAEEDVAVAEGDVARPTETPVTEHTSTAATIHRLFLFARNLRSFGRRAWLAVGTEADPSGEDAGGGSGAVPASPDVELDPG